MASYQDKIAIVTGGASGIGRAMSQQLVAAGATVIIADINLAAAEETAAAIGEKARAVQVDVTDADAVRALVESTVEAHQRLDYMFNNAGVAAVGEVADMDSADFDWMIDINVRGVIHGVLAAYAVMRRQGFGHIVNTGSLAGLTPTPMMTGYSASKHAVVGLSRGLQAEVRGTGIKVSVACPGIIQTPMIAANRHVGVDPAKVGGNMPMTPYDVDLCAADILRGVSRGRSLIVVTGLGKIAWILYRVAPSLFDWIAAREFRKTKHALT